MEVCIICAIFRDNGLGSKAMILRLLRVPLLWSIVSSWRKLAAMLEFVHVALMATADILLLGFIFAYFFGTVLWTAVVFSAVDPHDATLDFSGLTSSCYAVYLMLIGNDWHAHTGAIFAGIHNDSQRFGFVILFVMQFVGGHVLLNMFGSVVMASWSVCSKIDRAVTSSFTAKPVRMKRTSVSGGAQDDVALSLLPWTLAKISVDKHKGLTLETMMDDDDMAQQGRVDTFRLAFTQICASQVLYRGEGALGPVSCSESGCVVIRSQDHIILIDAADSDVAVTWAEDISTMVKWARAQFAVDAGPAPCKHDLLGVTKGGRKPGKTYACVRRRCSAIDVLAHDADLPSSLPRHKTSRLDLPLASHSENSNGIGQRSQVPHPPSSGNEMSCRTNTPRATPLKISDRSPRHTPRAHREESALMPSDEEASKHQMIAAVEPFKGLRPGDVNALASKMQILTARAGSTIIQEGKLGTVMIRILHGIATMYEACAGAGTHNTPRALRTLEKGAIIGQRELFEDVSAGSVSVQADTETTYIMLTKQVLVDLSAVRDSLRAKLLDNAAWLGTSAAWLNHKPSAPFPADADTLDPSEHTQRSPPTRERRSRSDQSQHPSRRSTGAGPCKPALERQPSIDGAVSRSTSRSDKASGARPGKNPARKEGTSSEAAQGAGRAIVPATSKGVAGSKDMENMSREGEGVDGSQPVDNCLKPAAEQPLGVTLSSNGPAPVYFSAEPGLKLATATALPPRSDQYYRHARPPATPPPVREESGGGGYRGGGIVLSPETPVVNKENHVALFNNNVVLPPGLLQTKPSTASSPSALQIQIETPGNDHVFTPSMSPPTSQVFIVSSTTQHLPSCTPPPTSLQVTPSFEKSSTHDDRDSFCSR